MLTLAKLLKLKILKFCTLDFSSYSTPIPKFITQRIPKGFMTRQTLEIQKLFLKVSQYQVVFKDSDHSFGAYAKFSEKLTFLTPDTYTQEDNQLHSKQSKKNIFQPFKLTLTPYSKVPHTSNELFQDLLTFHFPATFKTLIP